jgi:hypothetical protein
VRREAQALWEELENRERKVKRGWMECRGGRGDLGVRVKRVMMGRRETWEILEEVALLEKTVWKE